MLDLQNRSVGIQCKHTIVRYRDTRKAAVLLAEMLGLADPSQLGSMLEVQLDGCPTRCSAFLLCEDEFEQVVAALRARGLAYWGGPGKRQAQAICRRNGWRGLCFEDPDGHLLQVMTQPQSCVTEISP